jgi:hypothetical protein
LWQWRHGYINPYQPVLLHLATCKGFASVAGWERMLTTISVCGVLRRESSARRKLYEKRSLRGWGYLYEENAIRGESSARRKLGANKVIGGASSANGEAICGERHAGRKLHDQKLYEGKAVRAESHMRRQLCEEMCVSSRFVSRCAPPRAFIGEHETNQAQQLRPAIRIFVSRAISRPARRIFVSRGDPPPITAPSPATSSTA